MKCFTLRGASFRKKEVHYVDQEGWGISCLERVREREDLKLSRGDLNFVVWDEVFEVDDLRNVQKIREITDGFFTGVATAGGVIQTQVTTSTRKGIFDSEDRKFDLLILDEIINDLVREKAWILARNPEWGVKEENDKILKYQKLKKDAKTYIDRHNFS